MHCRDEVARIGSHGRDAEVENAWQQPAVLGGEKHVVRLQVPVDHTAPMRVLDGIADLDEQRDALTQAEPHLVGGGEQRLACDELHRQVGLAAALGRGPAEVEHAHDCRMVEPRQQVGFASEPSQHRGAGGASVQQFERDRAFWFAFLGLEDDAHATLAEEADDRVAIERASAILQRVRFGGLRNLGRSRGEQRLDLLEQCGIGTAHVTCLRESRRYGI
jgi:hypothetical protein